MRSLWHNRKISSQQAKNSIKLSSDTKEKSESIENSSELSEKTLKTVVKRVNRIKSQY